MNAEAAAVTDDSDGREAPILKFSETLSRLAGFVRSMHESSEDAWCRADFIAGANAAVRALTALPNVLHEHPELVERIELPGCPAIDGVAIADLADVEENGAGVLVLTPAGRVFDVRPTGTAEAFVTRYQGDNGSPSTRIKVAGVREIRLVEGDDNKGWVDAAREDWAAGPTSASILRWVMAGPTAKLLPPAVGSEIEAALAVRQRFLERRRIEEERTSRGAGDLKLRLSMLDFLHDLTALKKATPAPNALSSAIVAATESMAKTAACYASWLAEPCAAHQLTEPAVTERVQKFGRALGELVEALISIAPPDVDECEGSGDVR